MAIIVKVNMHKSKKAAACKLKHHVLCHLH